MKQQTNDHEILCLYRIPWKNKKTKLMDDRLSTRDKMHDMENEKPLKHARKCTFAKMYFSFSWKASLGLGLEAD